MNFYKEILSAQHFHLTMIIVWNYCSKGNADGINWLANQLIGLKGIIHRKLVTSKMIKLTLSEFQTRKGFNLKSNNENIKSNNMRLKIFIFY